MPVIVCENMKCENISKRRTKFENSFGEVTLRHTCKAKVVNMSPVYNGDDDSVEVFGYQPYECSQGRLYEEE